MSSTRSSSCPAARTGAGSVPANASPTASPVNQVAHSRGPLRCRSTGPSKPTVAQAWPLDRGEPAASSRVFRTHVAYRSAAMAHPLSRTDVRLGLVAVGGRRHRGRRFFMAPGADQRRAIPWAGPCPSPSSLRSSPRSCRAKPWRSAPSTTASTAPPWTASPSRRCDRHPACRPPGSATNRGAMPRRAACPAGTPTGDRASCHARPSPPRVPIPSPTARAPSASTGPARTTPSERRPRWTTGGGRGVTSR